MDESQTLHAMQFAKNKTNDPLKFIQDSNSSQINPYCICYISPPSPLTGIAVSSGGGMIITSSRGALSKLVATDELGAVFAVVGQFESLMPLLSITIFTAIYNNTLDFFPGTAFLLAALICLFLCFMYT